MRIHELIALIDEHELEYLVISHPGRTYVGSEPLNHLTDHIQFTGSFIRENIYFALPPIYIRREEYKETDPDAGNICYEVLSGKIERGIAEVMKSYREKQERNERRDSGLLL